LECITEAKWFRPGSTEMIEAVDSGQWRIAGAGKYRHSHHSNYGILMVRDLDGDGNPIANTPGGRIAALSIARAAGYTLTDIRSSKRWPRLVATRVKMIRALRADGWSFPRIGKLLNRHHSTIMHHAKGGEIGETGCELPETDCLQRI
jgi:hypothetical protein